MSTQALRSNTQALSTHVRRHVLECAYACVRKACVVIRKPLLAFATHNRTHTYSNATLGLSRSELYFGRVSSLFES